MEPNRGPQQEASAKSPNLLRELWNFMRVRKKYWLAPILLALALIGMLIAVAAQSGIVAPFIYALF